MDSRFIVCATRSMRSYARAVVDNLARYPSLAPFASSFDGVDALSLLHFSDGEIEVEVKPSIRGKTIYLFTSCARNEAGIPVEKAKMELYHTVDALKRAQAKRIVVFEPYVSCSRSDRTTRRNSVGLWVHFKTLTALGCSHILTFQLHSDKSKNMLDPLICAIDDVPALNLLKQYICDVHIKTVDNLRKEVRPNWAFCSVDAGGEKLARSFANAFGAALVIAHKKRDYTKANEVEAVHILSAEPLEGKTLWIVDDMIDTASSVQLLVRALAKQKPRAIHLAVVHPVLSPPACERLVELKEEGLLGHIVVSDSVNCSSEICSLLPDIELVRSKERAAELIYGIIHGRSLSRYFSRFDSEGYLTRGTLFTQAEN